MRTGVRSQTFTPADAFWFKLEVPTSTTLIAGLLTFDEPVDFARLREQIAGRLLRFDRFRQRPRRSILPFSLPVWEPAPGFDLDAHLHCTALPEPADWPQLQAFIQGLLSRPLPNDRPLWQFHLIQRYRAGSALVVCYSHVMADGFASMYLLECITDPAPPDRSPGPADALPPPPAPEPMERTLAGRVAAALDAADTALHLPGSMLRGALALTRDPSPAIRAARYRLQQGQAFARYVVMPPDRRTALRAPSTHAKRVEASEAIDLAELKAMGRTWGVTVNDLVASAVAGAFRRYLAGRGEQVDGLTLRATMPCNLRPPERSGELGNGFACVFVPLALGLADPLERLQAVKGGMDFAKSHPEAVTVFAVTGAAGFLPAPVTRLSMLFFINKVSTVLTNVPGLPDTRYLAGRRVDRVMFWVPTPCFLTMGISILSYAGRLTVCFDSDARAVPDLEAVVAAFAAEYAELKARCPLPPAVREPAAGREPDAAGTAPAPPFDQIFHPVGPDLDLERCRCQALTRAGLPCRNFARPGSDYCAVHARLAAPA
jgi:diacylglycerol O-acyltransferase / wax synthase